MKYQIKLLKLLLAIICPALALVALWQLPVVANETASSATFRQGHLVPAAITLTLTAASAELPTHGAQTTISAEVFDEHGQPVQGAVVTFTTTLGIVSPQSANTNADGLAAATFQSGAMPGEAIISAASGDSEVSISIRLQTPQVETLFLDIGNSQLATGETAAITATIHDQFNRPIEGELISLFGSFGEVSLASALSTANGQAIFRFAAGSMSGRARLSALSGYASHATDLIITDSAPPDFPNHVYLPLILK